MDVRREIRFEIFQGSYYSGMAAAVNPHAARAAVQPGMSTSCFVANPQMTGQNRAVWTNEHISRPAARKIRPDCLHHRWIDKASIGRLTVFLPVMIRSARHLDRQGGTGIIVVP
jgi:hypothetical protein